MKSLSMRSLVYTALFSAIFILFSALQIKLSISVVPITLQTLAVILSGIFLKPKQAFISIFLVVILAAIGLPLIGGKGGIGLIFGPTGGFVVAFPFGAYLISLFTERGLQSETLKQSKILCILYFVVTYFVLGLVFPYVIGIPWFMSYMDMGFVKSLTLACYPFLIGDLLKILASILILLALQKTITNVRFQQQ